MRTAVRMINWLLEPDNPPVRYLALSCLLDLPPDNPEVEEARKALMTDPVTTGILEHASEFGATGKDAYWKYKGAYWQIIFLGEFLADGGHPVISDLVSRLLAKPDWVSKSGGQCLTANLLAAFRRLGFGGHPVVEEQTERLAERLLTDRGIRCSVMDYSLLPACYMALPKLLRCFAEVPAEKRSAPIEQAMRFIVDELLAREVFVYVPARQKEWMDVLAHLPKKEELPPAQTVKERVALRREHFRAGQEVGDRVAKPGWSKFGFPLHYNSDILEALYALAQADVPMQPALERPLRVVEEKRTGDGHWLLENSMNGKMWVDVEVKGQPSKWITFRALRVLRHFDGERSVF